MQILYGTANRAKLASMQRVVSPLGITLIGLDEIKQPLPEIAETGNTPLENAVIKAEAYYRAFSRPVFSCDSGLYFDGLEEGLQPGTHVRRVNGRELTDEEMIEYYSGLAKRHGNRLTGRYRNAVCLIFHEGARFSSMDEALATEPFMLVGEAHGKRVKGFPLDSLSMDIASGRYYFDMEERSVESEMEQGFRAFFEEALAAFQKRRTAF